MDITKIKLPLLLVIGAVGSALTAGGTVALTSARVDATAKAVEKQEDEIETQALQIKSVEVELREFRKNTERSLDRIERAVGAK